MNKDTLGGENIGEIIKFLKEYSLMKIVSNIGPCNEKLNTEFIVNLSLHIAIMKGLKISKKVYVRGCYVKLSP